MTKLDTEVSFGNLVFEIDGGGQRRPVEPAGFDELPSTEVEISHPCEKLLAYPSPVGDLVSALERFTVGLKRFGGFTGRIVGACKLQKDRAGKQ